jgi:hypothetical protein
MFVPFRDGKGRWVGLRAAHIHESLVSLCSLVNREAAPDMIGLEQFLDRFGIPGVDADGESMVADVRDVRVEVGEDLFWCPQGLSAVRADDLDEIIGHYRTVYVLVDTMNGKPRHTQQEHLLGNHPHQRFRIWFTTDIFFAPRVPSRPMPGEVGERYIRLLPTDPVARTAPDGTQAVESRIHGKFVSRRTLN